jgi:hypothetical protein
MWNCRIVNEWIGKNVERRYRGLNLDTTLAFVWRDRGEPRETSTKIFITMIITPNQ